MLKEADVIKYVNKIHCFNSAYQLLYVLIEKYTSNQLRTTKNDFAVHKIVLVKPSQFYPPLLFPDTLLHKLNIARI